MKLHTIVLAALVVACCLVAHGCATTPSQVEARTKLWNEIVADGVVTKEEAAQFAALLNEQSKTIDWPTTIGTGIASVVTAFLGVNVYRNRTSPERTAEDLAKLGKPV